MTPIFNEYRSMLAHFGIDLSNYDEDKLWIDRLIIRGFDRNGKEHKICRLKVNDDLEYEYKFYNKIPNNEDLVTWEELYFLHETQIRERERESVQVIEEAISKYPNAKIFIGTSMGKDSRLVEALVNKVTVNYIKLFNNTTCDSPEVYKEVMADNNIEILTATNNEGKNLSIYNMARKSGFATRHHRWCCGIFKEENAKKRFEKETEVLEFLGMRNEESATRKDYQFEKQDDRYQPYVHIYLPIRKWSEIQVWLYELHNNIPVNDKYKKGYSRVGCNIICPFYTKSTWILDKYWYSKLFDRFHKLLSEDFRNGEKWCRLNCTEAEYHLNWNGGAVRENPTDEVIEEFMKYKGFDNTDLAKQYFIKTCKSCGKKVYKKNEVAMNLKYHGRNTNTFFCRKCFIKQMNWDKEKWNEQVESFKKQGCTLF